MAIELWADGLVLIMFAVVIVLIFKYNHNICFGFMVVHNVDIHKEDL